MTLEEGTVHNTDRNSEEKEWKELLAAARQEREEGRFRVAESYYRQAMKLNPNSVEILSELCVLLLKQRRETDAEVIGKMLLKRIGGKNLSWARLRSQLREKIIDTKRTPTASEPVDSPRQEQTEDQATIQLPLHKEGDEIRKSKTPEPALQVEPKKGEETPATVPATGSWKMFAERLMRDGKNMDAERILQNELLNNPNNVQALFLLGKAYYNQRMFKKAEEAFFKARKLDPASKDIIYMQGLCNLKMKEYETAFNLLQEAVNKGVNNVEALLNLGIAAFRSGMIERAKEIFQKALVLRKNDPRILTYLGMVLVKQGKLVPAENVFNLAIRSDPDFAPAWDQLGYTQIIRGRQREGQRIRARARSIARRMGMRLSLE